MRSLVIVSCFLAAFQVVGQQPSPKTAIRPAFKLAAEAAIDASDRIENLAHDDVYRPQMDRAQDKADELSRMAVSNSERAVAKAISSILIEVMICRLRGDVPDPDKFEASLDAESNDREQALILMHVHKEEGVWTPGAPKPEVSSPEFIQSAKSVVDALEGVDLKTQDDEIFEQRLEQAKQAQESLSLMASNAPEREIAKATGLILSETKTCHWTFEDDQEHFDSCAAKRSEYRQQALALMISRVRQ